MWNYRLPEQCCALCNNAYISTYGDAQCKLVTGILIDAGGVCDWFNVARDSIPLATRKTFQPPLAPIVGRKSVLTMEPEVETYGTCASCQGSMMRKGKPYCIIMCKNIKPTGTCKDYMEETNVHNGMDRDGGTSGGSRGSSSNSDLGLDGVTDDRSDIDVSTIHADPDSAYAFLETDSYNSAKAGGQIDEPRDSDAVHDSVGDTAVVLLESDAPAQITLYTCTFCKYAIFRNRKPWCDLYHKRIEPDGACAHFEKDA